MNNFIKYAILLMPLMVTSTNGQQHDNVWTFGYICVPGDSSTFGGTALYFYNCDIRFKNNCTCSISYQEGKLNLFSMVVHANLLTRDIRK
ncbi:MAG: hypothetical protein ACJA1A_003795 [Saprospiraceae bacterium]|jgi:hypothetical protein